MSDRLLYAGRVGARSWPAGRAPSKSRRQRTMASADAMELSAVVARFAKMAPMFALPLGSPSLLGNGNNTSIKDVSLESREQFGEQEQEESSFNSFVNGEDAEMEPATPLREHEDACSIPHQRRPPPPRSAPASTWAFSSRTSSPSPRSTCKAPLPAGLRLPLPPLELIEKLRGQEKSNAVLVCERTRQVNYQGIAVPDMCDYSSYRTLCLNNKAEVVSEVHSNVPNVAQGVDKLSYFVRLKIDELLPLNPSVAAKRYHNASNSLARAGRMNTRGVKELGKSIELLLAMSNAGILPSSAHICMAGTWAWYRGTYSPEAKDMSEP
ncbi:hypothetical protein C8R45DRAFT_1082678, partial [Mycena sanguinolenta]